MSKQDASPLLFPSTHIMVVCWRRLEGGRVSGWRSNVSLRCSWNSRRPPHSSPAYKRMPFRTFTCLLWFRRQVHCIYLLSVSSESQKEQEKSRHNEALLRELQKQHDQTDSKMPPYEWLFEYLYAIKQQAKHCRTEQSKAQC